MKTEVFLQDDHIMLPCQTCGGTASLEVWEEFGKTHAYVECDCGLITAMKSSVKGDKMIADIIKKYTKSKPRTLMDSGLKSCFCGSTDVAIEEFGTSRFVMCYNCFRTTEEGNSDGSFKTREQSIELWNTEKE